MCRRRGKVIVLFSTIERRKGLAHDKVAATHEKHVARPGERESAGKGFRNVA